MKRTILIFLFIKSFFVLNAQELHVIKEKEQHSLSMFFNIISENNESVAYFVNGKISNLYFIKNISPKFIDSISVVKKSVILDDKEYQGQIYIVTKNDYNPKYVSLLHIRKEYIKEKKLPCLFFIDGAIIEKKEDSF